MGYYCRFIGFLLLQVSSMALHQKAIEARRDTLLELRKLMNKMNVSAFIVTSTDDHLSERVMAPDMRIAYLSGFTGSNGLIVVTNKKALLWTDSRYFIQANRQINSELWTLMKFGEVGVPKAEEWIRDNLSGCSCKVGVDARKMEATQFGDMKKMLANKEIELVSISLNLVDEVWKDKPEYPHSKVNIYDIKYAGETWESKVSRVLKKLKNSSLVVTALDEVAWLTNLRGSDFYDAPLFRSFLILDKDKMNLYISMDKVSPNIFRYFESDRYQVNIKNYNEFWDDLADLAKSSEKILLPNKGTSYYIQDQFPADKIENKASPIMEMKSYKNAVEADGMRKAHIRDAVALCELIRTLTIEVENDTSKWDEMRVIDELKKLRRKQELNYGISFDTVAAFGPNSALPHYVATKETNLQITAKGPLTIDSGGQYLDGTIDTTRVVRPGVPSKSEIEVYTALLKGVIDGANTVFPEDTKMKQLDFIVRRPLYQTGRDFGHGISHGTGVFLNVHEAYNGSLKENFIGSQEPGYYKENDFGMRLENLVIVVPANIENHTRKTLLTFEPLTLVPYERKLIDFSQMDKSQIKWLNDYHSTVRKKVGEEMLKQNHESLHAWLMEQTEPFLYQQHN